MSQAVVKPVLITKALLDGGCTTTVSNTSGAWALIHAPTCPDYRRALDSVPRGDAGHLQSESLCSVQLRMSARYESVEPVWCLRGYFYLRNTSNLGNTWPAGRGQYPTLQAAMDAALTWCLEAPAYREAVVGTRDLREAGIKPEEWEPPVQRTCPVCGEPQPGGHKYEGCVL